MTAADNTPVRIAARKPRYAQVWETALSPELSDSAVRLYAVLDRFEGTNPDAWPSRQLLAEKCAWSLSKLKRVVKELVAAGLLEVEQRVTGDPGHEQHDSNLYTLTPFEATVTPFTTRRNGRGGGVTSEPRGGVTSEPRGGVTSEPRGGVTSDPQKEPQLEGTPDRPTDSTNPRPETTPEPGDGRSVCLDLLIRRALEKAREQGTPIGVRSRYVAGVRRNLLDERGADITAALARHDGDGVAAAQDLADSPTAVRVLARGLGLLQEVS